MIPTVHYTTLISALKRLPNCPGVYLFKDGNGTIVYIGKAKDLKKRGASYVQRLGSDIKVDALFAASQTVEHQATSSELEALLLEAKLIQSNQPKYNVLLKSGQPFVYLFISSGKLPELKIVRSNKQKGTYFGPFLEKTYARKVYDFLIKTFHLKLCKKKIENGCLDYHMGLCSGFCRSGFDSDAYRARLEMAKQSLQQGHKKFLVQLKKQIDDHSKCLEFERAQELYGYYQAFERVFESIDHKPADLEHVARKDIWILSSDKKQLFVFNEYASVLKKKRVFYMPFDADEVDAEMMLEYFMGYYRLYTPPATILSNVELGIPSEIDVIQAFLQTWHEKDYRIKIICPIEGHDASLVRLGLVHAETEQAKQATLAASLKRLLALPREPRTIDCFDISHKQGMFMVGSCVRFTDGKPDKQQFRHFHIKTVEHQDDYACLREIVARRYKDKTNVPDLVVIDGGKGQLSAVADLIPGIECISLAKREETVFSNRFPDGKKLDQKSHAGQMLIALRDYAHHFAISFHRHIQRSSLVIKSSNQKSKDQT